MPTPTAITAKPSTWPLPPWAAALSLLFMGVAFTPGVRDMVGRWMMEGGYYGHGPLVPFACAAFLYLDRERLRGIPLTGNRWGLVIIGGCMLVLAFSVLEDIHVTQNLALVGTIWGATLLFCGWRFVRAAWFPLFFLLFMVPLPQVLIARITFDMKLLAAQLAVGCIELMGVPVILKGSWIHLSDTSVLVDDVCSGLRTLMTLGALAVVFAWLEPDRIRSAIVLLLAVPVAIAVNVARILVLTWLAAIRHPAAHEGFLHEMTGIGVYALAFGLFWGIHALLAGATARDEDADGQGPEPARPPVPPEPKPTAEPPSTPGWMVHSRAGLGSLLGLLGLLGLGAGASAAWGFNPPSLQTSDLTRHIPATIGPWSSEDIEMSDRVYVLLDTRDVLLRNYRHPRLEAPVQLYLVHAPDSRKVAHPPEICFAGAGFIARDRRSDELVLPDGRRIPTNYMLLEEGRQTLMVHFWYRLDGRNTTSVLDHQLEALWRRLTSEARSGSMVRISTPVGPGGLEAANKRIARFVDQALPTVVGTIEAEE